jgi:8-amino-7-oxononanoate synthase
MNSGFYDFSTQLAELKQQGLYRRRRTLEGSQGPVVTVDGKAVVNFCSNDYLGLANHPDVAAAFKAGIERYGSGSGSAHLICGHSQAHHALEDELTAFTGRARALLFSTGYMANLGIVSALVGRGDTLLEDRLNHASLLDGGLLSGARFKRFRHGDYQDLQAKLAEANGRVLVASDGVFSMDGDLADLPTLAGLASEHGAGLLIDDAHGFGVLGATGVGTVEHFGLTADDVPILMGTLGKACGTFGAFVAGSDDLIEFLIQKARSYVFTTALPAAVAEATRASLRLIQVEGWRRQHLQMLVRRFKTGAHSLGLALMPSDTAIQPIVIGDSQRAVAISALLMERGCWVSAIRPPTVPAGSARLRVTLSAEHSERQIDDLLDALAQVMA